MSASVVLVTVHRGKTVLYVDGKQILSSTAHTRRLRWRLRRKGQTMLAVVGSGTAGRIAQWARPLSPDECEEIFRASGLTS